jgi:hypothetical protein
MEAEMYVPVWVIVALLVGWYVYRYYAFKERTAEAEREADKLLEGPAEDELRRVESRIAFLEKQLYRAPDADSMMYLDLELQALDVKKRQLEFQLREPDGDRA